MPAELSGKFASCQTMVRFLCSPAEVPPARINDAVTIMNSKSRLKTAEELKPVKQILSWGAKTPLPLWHLAKSLMDNCPPKLYEHLVEGGYLNRFFLSMRPADIMTIAFSFVEAGEDNFSEELLEIARGKAQLLNSFSAANQRYCEKNLPELCFPVVIHGEYPVIFWEKVLCDAKLRNYLSDFSPPDLDGVTEIEKLMGYLFGPDAKTDFVCPGNQLFGLKPNGESCSLAVFCALWANASGLEIPKGGVMLTGRVDEKGNVKKIADAELKVEIALASGFSYVFLPSENLREDAKRYSRDKRVIGLESVYDLIDFLRQHDAKTNVKRRLISFASGINKSFPDRKHLTGFIEYELQKDRWGIFFKNIQQLYLRNWNKGSEKKIITTVIKVGEAFSSILKRNFHEKIDRKIWFGIFQQIIPETIFLLHLPVLLFLYSQKDTSKALSLYHRNEYRLGNHDLNLSLAVEMGRHFFESGHISPWFEKTYRVRFPFLCWFLFSDCLAAIYHLISWSDLNPREKNWLETIETEFIKAIEDEGVIKLSRSNSAWEKINLGILKKAARQDFPDFSPNEANVTLFGKRPAYIFKLLMEDLAGNKCLKQHSRQILFKLAIEMLDNVEYKDKKGSLARDQFVKSLRSNHWDESFAAKISLPDNSPEIVQECFHVIKAVKAPKKSHDWVDCIKRAMATGLSIDAEDEVRKQIRALDKELSYALIGFFKTQPAADKGFLFQCLTNPAWAIFCVGLEYRHGRLDGGKARECLLVWWDMLDQNALGFGFRQHLIKECLRYFAGMIAFRAGFPEINNTVCFKNTSFRIGFHESSVFKNPDEVASLKSLIIKNIRQPELRFMIWLGRICRLFDGNDFINEARKIVAKPEADDKARLLLALCEGACQGIDSGKVVEKFLQMPDRNVKTKYLRQGLLPLLCAWEKNPDEARLNEILTKLAKSRGFSPMCLVIAGLSGDIDYNSYILQPQFWQLEWEKEMMSTFLIARWYFDGRLKENTKFLTGSFIDLKNSILMARLMPGKVKI